MNYTITWQIIDLYREVPSGYVYKAKFKVSAFCPKSQKTVSVLDQVLLDMPEKLIPFNDLSEDVVISWVQNKSNKDKLELDLCSQLKLIAEPKISKGLPWKDSEIYAETIHKPQFE